MDPGRIQTIIAGMTLLAGLVGVYASLNARLTTLERQVESVENQLRDDRKIVTGELIELMKMVHQMKGAMPVNPDQRGPR